MSDTSFVAPYRLIGCDALSVESAITFFTPLSILASIIFCAPVILVFMNVNKIFIGSIFGLILAYFIRFFSLSFNGIRDEVRIH